MNTLPATTEGRLFAGSSRFKTDENELLSKGEKQ